MMPGRESSVAALFKVVADVTMASAMTRVATAVGAARAGSKARYRAG